MKKLKRYFIYFRIFTVVGAVGIPVYLYSMVTGHPTEFYSCLLVIIWIMMLTTISILHLVSVSLDRYLVIVHYRTHTSHQRKKYRAWVLICMSWVLGTLIGLMPLMGWHGEKPAEPRCIFMEVMDFQYLMFLYFGTMILPTLLMVYFYIRIYFVTNKQVSKNILENYRNSIN